MFTIVDQNNGNREEWGQTRNFPVIGISKIDSTRDARAIASVLPGGLSSRVAERQIFPSVFAIVHSGGDETAQTPHPPARIGLPPQCFRCRDLPAKPRANYALLPPQLQGCHGAVRQHLVLAANAGKFLIEA